MSDESMTPLPPPEATQVGKTETGATEKGSSPKASPSTTFDGTVGGLLEVDGGAEIMDAMLMGLAMSICNDMKHHQDKLKEMGRKGRQDAQG